MKRVWIGSVAWLVCCIAAAGASAATYCVVPESSGCDQTFPSVQSALTQAGNDTSADTVKLGAATYNPGTAVTLSSTNAIAIVGHGSDQTILTLSGSQTNAIVLMINDQNATLAGVGIVVPAGNTNTGLSSFGARADGVAITGPNATNPTGLNLVGTFLRGSIDLPSSSSNQSTGVTADNGTLEDTTIRAHTGLAQGGSFGATSARHDTFIGDGGAGSVGISATATPATVPGAGTTVTLADSIVRGFASDLVRQGANGDPTCLMNPGFPCPTSALITYSYDDFDTVNPQAVDSGPGQYMTSGHNLAVDPAFVGASASPPDYHLLHSSLLIDAGMAAPESGESTQDEDGNPRTVGAATDMGAYEYQHRPPTITAGATPGSAQTDTPFTFSATASDPDPGDAVTVTWSFDDGATGSGASVSHAFSTSGVHTATATATDPTGLTRTAPTSVTVTEPTGPSGPTGPVPPVISHLNLTPAAFRAARSGPSISAVKTGTTISYTDSQAADTTFIVERVVTGIKRGRSCVQPPRKKAKHPTRCTRFVHVGGFLHRDVAGANRFHFSGRIFGKALPPGNYRLSAEPQNAQLLVGNLVKKPFRIIAPPRKRHRRH